MMLNLRSFLASRFPALKVPGRFHRTCLRRPIVLQTTRDSTLLYVLPADRAQRLVSPHHCSICTVLCFWQSCKLTASRQLRLVVTPITTGKHIAKRHLTYDYSSTSTITLVLCIVVLTHRMWIARSPPVAKIYTLYTSSGMTNSYLLLPQTSNMSQMILAMQQAPAKFIYKKDQYYLVFFTWWAIQDSNLSPPQRQCGALAK